MLPGNKAFPYSLGPVAVGNDPLAGIVVHVPRSCSMVRRERAGDLQVGTVPGDKKAGTGATDRKRGGLRIPRGLAYDLTGGPICSFFNPSPVNLLVRSRSSMASKSRCFETAPSLRSESDDFRDCFFHFFLRELFKFFFFRFRRVDSRSFCSSSSEDEPSSDSSLESVASVSYLEYRWCRFLRVRVLPERSSGSLSSSESEYRRRPMFVMATEEGHGRSGNSLKADEV